MLDSAIRSMGDRLSRYKTRSQIIHDALRREILLGTLCLGQELRQDEIAERFEVSRIPVREALQTLAAEGLVELRTHQKALVRKYSAKEIEDIFLVRSLLEPRAVRLGPSQPQPGRPGGDPHAARADGRGRRSARLRALSGAQPRVPHDHLSRRRQSSHQPDPRALHRSARRASFTSTCAPPTRWSRPRPSTPRSTWPARAWEPDVLERVILDHVRQTLALLNESAFQSLKA